jgi:hypothetical protein
MRNRSGLMPYPRLSEMAFGHNRIPCSTSVFKVPETQNRWGIRYRLKGFRTLACHPV